MMDLLPIYKTYLYKSELTLLVSYVDIYKILFFLKYHTKTQYKILIDICAIDYPSNYYRFHVVYGLLSIRYNHRLFVKTKISESIKLKSVTRLYFNANWCEREIWDLFGIFFKKHPDLRRILTDYGFEGFALRKDFPLMGLYEICYSEYAKRITSQCLELKQEYRMYSLVGPWINRNRI